MSARIALLAGIVNVFISLFAWHETASLAFKILGIISFISAYILNRIKEKKKLKEQDKNELSPEDQEKLLALIKDNCDSKHRLRNNELSSKFQSITTGYSSRGFDTLPGMAFGEFADLYIKELYAYSDILADTILEILNSDKLKLSIEPLKLLAQEMIQNKANEFNSYFCSLVDHHSKFHQGPQPDIMIGTKTSFTNRIDKEAVLNISKISTQLDLKNMA